MEFYFVRHGQTDYNILEGPNKGDHPHDTPLNQTGREQAKSIEPRVASLPIKTVVSSPLKRVQETKEIITERLQVNHYNVEAFTECSAQIWNELRKLGMYTSPPKEGIVRPFIDRVQSGIHHTLSLPGPTLIVAHGGVHWALCCLMGIQNHNWIAKNCALVHFTLREDGTWTASL